MDRYIAGLLCIAGGVLMLPAAQAGEVVFADTVIDRLVRAVLDNQNEPIFASDLIGDGGVTELRSELALIEDLGGIEFLLDLEVLELPNNIISDLSALSGLRNLRTLDLSGNAITDISALENVTSLVNLDLADNGIEDLTPLAGLVNLNTLSLQNNDIRDLSSFVNNGGLGSGDLITLTGNPLNQDSLCVVIPPLEARGAMVIADGGCQGVIEGVIRDAVTFDRIDCAIVIARSGFSGIGIGLTGVGGEYHIDDLGAGDYELLVFAPGYERQSGTGTISTATISTAAFSLVPSTQGLAVTGVVTEAASGLFLAGIEVTAVDGANVLDTTFSCALGRYELEIENADPTTFNVIFQALGFETESEAVDLDQSGSLNVSMTALQSFNGGIEGNVIDIQDRNPLPDARVIVKAIGSVFAFTTATDASGDFRVENLAPGEYSVQFSTARSLNQDFRKRVDVENVVVSIPTVTLGVAGGPGCSPQSQSAGPFPMGDIAVLLLAALTLLAYRFRRAASVS